VQRTRKSHFVLSVNLVFVKISLAKAHPYCIFSAVWAKNPIYIQAKRWENTVGRPDVQKFAGALQGHRAKKGIFITTSDFSKKALDFVLRIDSKIVLIDGETLAQHMIDHNVGVSLVAAYEIKKIDSDYFLEP
jgi:restriction endonuclease Mrr